jgi:hypothetical protein
LHTAFTDDPWHRNDPCHHAVRRRQLGAHLQMLSLCHRVASRGTSGREGCPRPSRLQRATTCETPTDTPEPCLISSVETSSCSTRGEARRFTRARRCCFDVRGGAFATVCVPRAEPRHEPKEKAAHHTHTVQRSCLEPSADARCVECSAPFGGQQQAWVTCDQQQLPSKSHLRVPDDVYSRARKSASEVGPAPIIL